MWIISGTVEMSKDVTWKEAGKAKDDEDYQKLLNFFSPPFPWEKKEAGQE
jgi:hypothetical protein